MTTDVVDPVSSFEDRRTRELDFRHAMGRFAEKKKSKKAGGALLLEEARCLKRLEDFAVFFEKTTGRALEADDFVRPDFPGRKTAFMVLEQRVVDKPDEGRALLKNIMDFLEKKKIFFSLRVMEESQTPVLLPCRHPILCGSVFFNPLYWQHNTKLLEQILQEPEKYYIFGPSKSMVRKCLDDAIQMNNQEKKQDQTMVQDTVTANLSAKKVFSPEIDVDVEDALVVYDKNYVMDDDCFLGGVYYEFKDLEDLSRIMRDLYGRDLQADDLCRVQRKNGKYLNFFGHVYEAWKSGGYDSEEDVVAVLKFFKKHPSQFSYEALLVGSLPGTHFSSTSLLGNDSTPLEVILQCGLERVFISPKFLSRETLEKLIAKHPSAVQAATRALERLDRRGGNPVTATQEVAVLPPEEKVEPLVALQEVGNKMDELLQRDVRQELEGLAQEPHKLWGYGDDVMRFRRDFLVRAAEVSISLQMHEDLTQTISAFRTDFSKARSMLDAYAAHLLRGEEQGFWERFTRWKRFAEKKNEEIEAFNEALRLSSSAGSRLQGMVEGLEKAEGGIAENLAVDDYINMTNQKIEKLLGTYIEVGKDYLKEQHPHGAATCEVLPPEGKTELMLAPSTAGATGFQRLETKLSILEEVHLSTQADMAKGALSSRHLSHIAELFSLQNGTLVGDLANNVRELHRSLHSLRSSVSAESLATASREAVSQEHRNAVMVAQKTFDAITSTLDSTRANVDAYNEQALALVSRKEPLSLEAPEKVRVKKAEKKAVL